MTSIMPDTVDFAESKVSVTTQMSFRRRRVYCLLTVVLLVVITIAGHRLWVMHSGLERARQEIKYSRWSRARDLLQGYLTLYPDDGEARLMMAEAFIKDDANSSGNHTEQAILHLQLVGDDSPLAWKARLQEARLVFLLQLRPDRAEHLLRASLRLNPNSLEAHLLMWRLLDLTGRHIVSRDHFWRVYELSSPQDRGSRLRDWFFSEFYPEIANAEFFSRMRIPQNGKFPPEVILLMKFRDNEPEASYLHAALAEYFLKNGNRKSSLALLKETPHLKHAMQNPFYTAVLFETLVDLGEFQRAETCFHQWPSPHEGYLYWRAKGSYFQNIKKEPANAVDAYQKASLEWPARFDWHLMMSLAACYRNIGDTKQSLQLQSRVTFLTEKVLTKEKLDWIRNNVGDLHDRLVCKAVCELYREFGLSREADAWEQLILTTSKSGRE